MRQRTKIELRVTEKTIYMDIVNMPDPLQFGVTIRYFNYDSVTLYFRITGSGTGYSGFGPVDLGSLGAGANARINLDNFFSRAKPAPGDLPSGEKQETITLTLRAYTDAGYTNLKWTYNRTVTIYFINSADPSFTQDFYDNFDDGTVQGWAVACISNCWTGFPVCAVATDYYLSPSYSLKGRNQATNNDTATGFRLYKSFTTPNVSKVFAIIDIRVSRLTGSWMFLKRAGIYRAAVQLQYIGKPYDNVQANYIPLDKWMRFVVPLPVNTTLEMRIALEDAYPRQYAPSHGDWEQIIWLDDFKIISK